MSRFLVGIDVGGTFTDFVALDHERGEVAVWKNLSTPADPTDGVLEGLAGFADRTAEVAHVRIGTTVATNTILERRGARVAYVATEGFRDVPFIQRGNRKSHYDITWVKPDPLVKRRDCFEVRERVDRDGRILEPLDEASVRAAAAEIAARGEAEAVAVCLLFSFLDPTHEQRVREILADALPGIPVSISYDVLPKWKEYERASTTIADAYLRPGVGRYLDTMGTRLDAFGLGERVAVIKSNGGETTLRGAAHAPVHLAVSGPSGGVIGARHLARATGLDRLVTLDMGGTSTDCSVVTDGEARFTTDFEVEWGLPVQVPMIDIRTIGAGGGSIAWRDRGGMLNVGPQSAGALPGPACYGRGGEAATVTDANLLLGRLAADRFLGGQMRLDVAAAERAMRSLAEEIGLGMAATAEAVLGIATNNMVGALRAVLLERGLDPREFTLCAFGGAGPLHLCELMREAGIARGIVPMHPGQFSAYGFLLTDARVDRHQTVQLTSHQFPTHRATGALADAVSMATGELLAQGYAGPFAVTRAVEMRYLGQNYELEVPLDFDAFDDVTTARLWASFHDLHAARYGFDMRGSVMEIVNIMATAVAHTDRPPLPEIRSASGRPSAEGSREVTFEGKAISTPVYVREQLGAGQTIEGPALVEESASVTVLAPGYALGVDPHGNLEVHAT